MSLLEESDLKRLFLSGAACAQAVLEDEGAVPPAELRGGLAKNGGSCVVGCPSEAHAHILLQQRILPAYNSIRSECY